MPKPKTFRVSDETITCYGVRILSSGLQIDAFLANPVMLYMHVRGRVIGRWNNLRQEGNEWLAEPEFDTEIELGAEIGGQVERDFLKAGSIVAEIVEVVYNEDLKCYDATKTILQEISIVDIGGNRNALRLCDNRGEILTEDQAKGYLLQLSNQQSKPFIPNTETMDYKAIALAAGLPETATQEQIAARVIELKAGQNDGGYKERYEALVKQTAEAQQKVTVSLVDAAIADKRITVAQKETYVELFAQNHDLATKILASLPVPQDLVKLVSQGQQQSVLSSATEDLAERYHKMDQAGTLIQLKQSNPAEFKQLFVAAWGKEPS